MYGPVTGIDNDMRQHFFGPHGSTLPVIESLQADVRTYRHRNLDIRDRQGVRDLLAGERPDFIIHTAAQPSHDKAASIPYDDFDVNAVGTMNMLVAARDYCQDSPFCFTSTNKVYGDRPNYLPLTGTRKALGLCRRTGRHRRERCRSTTACTPSSAPPRWRPT